MKYFPDEMIQRPKLAIVLGIAGIGLTLPIAWQARAALPRWMQDAVGSSAIEAALYRAMEIPGAKALYPRPPKEAQSELSGLIAKSPGQAELYSLRAMEEEQALDFAAAEKDWKEYAAHSKDGTGAKLELADYYHRRLQPRDEAAVLMDVGSAAAEPGEQYVAAPEQRSWKAFERLMALADDQALGDETIARGYAAWIARYPKQPSLYAREFHWLVGQGSGEGSDTARLDRAREVVSQYRKAFPQDAVFPLKASALLELRRGSVAKAIAIYDSGFEPLWPAELVQSYYALLADTHNERRFVADARAKLAQNPDDLNAMARLFYYAQQKGNLPTAQQTIDAYRLSKQTRKAAWSAQELYTLANLTEAIHAYPEAARYNFALYHSQGALASSMSAHLDPQSEGLSGIIRILLIAPDQPVELGAGNLSMYRDIATLDQGPGYWNGILSLWLNAQSPEQSYHEEEQKAQPYFHRAKAAELLATLDKNYPKAAARAELHRELIGVLASYGESAQVVKDGEEFLTAFPSPANEDDRVLVAMDMADAYARMQDTKGEFALYDRLLGELGGMTAGMPLTAATASNHAPAGTGAVQSGAVVVTSETTADTGNGAAAPTQKRVEQSRAFEVSAGAPAGVFVAGAQEYSQVLERYLGRLTAAGQLPQALALLRGQLDRNPNDPLLYERLAEFLEQNNLSAQQEAVYSQAIQKFQDKGWYDKLARLYLREKKREAFADLTKQVTNIFHGTELEEYFGQVNQGGPQLYLQLNLYAHQRFPHDEVFINNLLGAYRAKSTYDLAAWEKLLREHWNDSEELRREFFDYLNSKGKLDAELAQLRTIAPDAAAQRANPAAARELAEVEMWRSHYEASAPLLASLAEAYPAEEEVGAEASSIFRSLAYYDSSQTNHAVAIEKNLLAARPADTDRLARIGDIYSDSGADGTLGHENIAAAAPYWRRMTEVHPGTPDGYLQAATIFWDYFQFDEAMKEIEDARTKFRQPALYGYEAGAIDEGKRDFAGAIHEYTAAAASGKGNEDAAGRLMQLARRKATAKLVDAETGKAVEGNGSVAALELRERVLEVQKRGAEIGPLLEAALAKATTLEEAQAIAAQAQAHTLPKVFESALQREIALTGDPVEKIELSYDLMRSYEGRKDTADAERVVNDVYRDNPKLLGVVRSTVEYYTRNKQPAKAIDTLLEAAKTAEPVQPALAKQFIVEAADKANGSGSYAQARTLMTPLIDPARVTVQDAYNAEYLAVVADSYARAGDDAGLKQFYLDRLAAIRGGAQAMTADERKQRTVLLRRGLIPALTRMKDYAGAADQYIAILSAYPEDSNTTQEASLYAVRWGRQQQLVDFAAGTVKASPKDSRFAIQLAQMQTTFGNYPAAIDAYAHALTIRADRTDVYEAKADLEERLQRLDDACKEYERLYLLSYQNSDWMVKVAAVRARQGRKDDAVKALERAWIDGHAAGAQDYFRVAAQLETWQMLDESLHFAELGVKAEGERLLAGSEPGERNTDDPQGATIYTRLLTRMRQTDKALVVLDAARADAEKSPNSPGVIVEQVEKQGLASVTNDEWRKHRVAERKSTAAARYQAAVLEMAKTAGEYFTPEEKGQFAQVVDGRWKASSSNEQNDRLMWIDAAKAAGIADEEAHMRKQWLLDHASRGVKPADTQILPYAQLERSRMEFTELAETLDAYAAAIPANRRTEVLLEEAAALRSAGDERAELRVLRRINFEGNQGLGDRERYLALLLKYDLPAFEAFGGSSSQDEIALAAPNHAVMNSDVKVTRAALTHHGKAFPGAWQNAYSALVGLYFRDRSATTETAFHSILADEKTIAERIASHVNSSDEEGAPQQLAGNAWFYYGMRYGVYRTLAPEKEWPQHDPEDFMAAQLERNASAANYIGLARAYADAGRTSAALTEYRHVLELAPDSASAYDAMALLLWDAGKKDEAVAQWKKGITALDRVQNKGAAPESFWSGFALIARHVGDRKLTAQIHLEMDSLLRGYLARNGNYRSNELLKAAFKASATQAEGTEWLLSLSTAASDPAAILSDIDTASWMPVESREPVLLRQLELVRIAVAHAGKDTENGNQYDSYRLEQIQSRLVDYYVEQKQNAKAEATLQQMTEEQRRQYAVQEQEIVLAARGHRLEALLVKYREDAESIKTRFARSEAGQALRSAAASLAREDDKASALAIWEFVFEQGQLRDDLAVSDYMGLAEARIANGDIAGAVTVLRGMTMQRDDTAPAWNEPKEDSSEQGMANYNHAATLLMEKGHTAEAIEFLSVLARGVPWNGAYQLRLAQAQLSAGQNKAEALKALASLASDKSASYKLRVEAAQAMRGEAHEQLTAGSGELDLLAAGKITVEQARQPYFAAARIAAADSITDAPQRAALLREAIAITPGDASVDGDDLRLKVFRAEAAAGHDATAFDMLPSLVSHVRSAPDETASVAAGDEADAQADSADDGAADEVDSKVDDAIDLPADPEVETLATLEAQAPMPLRPDASEAEKVALASTIAHVYEKEGSPGSALMYFKLAAYLQKEPAAHGELQRHVDQLTTANQLEAQNLTRRPVIQRALNQSAVVRPRLTKAAELSKEAQ